MSNNDLYLYHYGVPGMKWGERKAVPISGQNVRIAKKQTVNKSTPRKQTVNKTAPKKQTVQKSDPQKQQVQENTEPSQKNSALKKGLIIAGVALAAIGTAILVSKYTKSLASNGKGAAEKILSTKPKVKSAAKSGTDVMKKTLTKEAKVKPNIGGDFIIKDRKKLTKQVFGQKSSMPKTSFKTSVFNGKQMAQKTLSKGITPGKQSKASKAFWKGMRNMPKNLTLKDLLK